MVKKKEIGGGIMCRQLDVLKKMRKKKTITPDMFDLAEAQAEDYIEMNKRLTSIESEVAQIRTEQVAQGSKLDLIIQQLNSPTEGERVDGAIWREIKSFLTTWKGGVAIFLTIGIIALAGQRVFELIKILW